MVKRNLHQHSLTPAPGHYEIKTMHRGPSFTISRARREAKIKSLPGPGDYFLPATIGIASLKKKFKR